MAAHDYGFPYFGHAGELVDAQGTLPLLWFLRFQKDVPPTARERIGAVLARGVEGATGLLWTKPGPWLTLSVSSSSSREDAARAKQVDEALAEVHAVAPIGEVIAGSIEERVSSPWEAVPGDA